MLGHIRPPGPRAPAAPGRRPGPPPVAPPDGPAVPDSGGAAPRTREKEVHVPKLSVVVALHNVEAFAETTLRSLARNAGPDVEFLLVDDCSTDATAEVVDRWAERLPGARVIRHDTNRG